MGMFRMSECQIGARGGRRQRGASNPNPAKFAIVRAEQYASNTVAVIHYPDARNYEGNKVCLYRNVTVAELRAATVLDPHFCPEHLAPFARFEPTDAGWEAAVTLAQSLR